jgi:DNA-directed RNA polymerase subunit RPC12/RpoP
MAREEPFRCMMCGHEYTEAVEPGEDRERSCPRCRSNSIRHLKRPKAREQKAS